MCEKTRVKLKIDEEKSSFGVGFMFIAQTNVKIKVFSREISKQKPRIIKEVTS